MAVLGHYYWGGKVAGGVCVRAHVSALPPRGSGGMPLQKIFLILGPLKWVLVQSESVRAFMPASLIVIP